VQYAAIYAFTTAYVSFHIRLFIVAYVEEVFSIFFLHFLFSSRCLILLACIVYALPVEFMKSVPVFSHVFVVSAKHSNVIACVCLSSCYLFTTYL